MGDVINLNKFRKDKARKEKAARAERNRVKHGASATERAKVKAERDKLLRDLEGKRLLDTDDDDQPA